MPGGEWDDAVMNVAQRVVLSLALAAALIVAARTTSDLLSASSAPRWVMYEPNANVLIPPSHPRWHSVRAAVIWLAAIALWFGISWRLFRTRGE